MSKIELPYDINSESGIICTLIHNPEYAIHSEHLTPSYFYKKENGAIYWAIQELFKKGIDKIDEFNLNTQINSNKGVKNIVESVQKDFLSELVNMSEFVARHTLEEYRELVNKVVSLSFRRELYKKLKYFEGICINTEEDLNQLNMKIIDDLDKIATKYISKEEIPLYKDVIDDIWNKMVSKRNGDGTFGMLSKFPILEDYFTYQSGELILFAARRKHGKSVIAMNELVHKLKQGVPSVYFDTEMNDEIFTSRMLSHLTGVEVYKINAGSYTSSEELLIKDAIQWFKSVPFTHIYEPLWTKDLVYTKAKILKHKINFQFFIYDYIKITDNSTTSSSEQYNELGNWCNFLKNNIAGGFDVPVMSMVQLNRNNEIADSDKIERYASTGIKWMKKTPEEVLADGEKCGNYKMQVMFNRLGKEMDEDDYLDFVFDTKSLSINECRVQHTKEEPEFMND